MSADSVLAEGALVLVTGANGFIGSHVADQLLQAGYRVKGTVRSDDKGKIITEALEKRHKGADRFSYVVVEDMSADRAFQEAVKGCDAVAHVASDFTFRNDPNLVIPAVTAGVRNALSAAASTPSVKRVVLTSSSDALGVPQGETEYHFNKDSWNEIVCKEAWKPENLESPMQPMIVYAASKVEGERAAWEFVKTEKPQFVLNTICPNFNIGEILDKRQAGSTAGLVKALWEGNEQIARMLQQLPPQFEVDVKDVARLHVAGLTLPDVQEERLLGFNERFNYGRWCEAIRKIDPSRKLPEPKNDEPKNISTVETSRSVELLKRLGYSGFTSLDDSMKQLVASIS